MLLIANKDEIRFARKHIGNVSNNGFAINFDQRLGHSVAYLAKTLPKARHRDYYLHTKLRITLSFLEEGQEETQHYSANDFELATINRLSP